jgi:hypothetical protein
MVGLGFKGSRTPLHRTNVRLVHSLTSLKAMQPLEAEGNGDAENDSITIDLPEAPFSGPLSCTTTTSSRRLDNSRQQEECLTSPRSERSSGLESMAIADRMLSPVLSRAREQHLLREAELDLQRRNLSGEVSEKLLLVTACTIEK